MPPASEVLEHETGSHYIAQAGLKLEILMPHLPGIGIIAVLHYTWLANPEELKVIMM
jgi:hypothetical protein